MDAQSNGLIDARKTNLQTNNNEGMLVYTTDIINNADELIREQHLFNTNDKTDKTNLGLFSTSSPKNILVIGNGFDIEAGIHSSYSDFILYIIYGCVFYQYHEIWPEKKNKPFDKQIFKEYIYSTNNDSKYSLRKQFDSSYEIWELCHKFAKSTLGEVLLKKGIIPLSYGYLIDSNIKCNTSIKIANLHSKEPDAKDFALGLSPKRPYTTSVKLFSYLDTGKNEDKNVINKTIETIDFLITQEYEENKENIELWLDVENVIEMLILKQENLLEKYNYKDKKLDEIPRESYLEGLNIFEELLSEYLKKEEKNIIKESTQFFKKITKDYSDSLFKRSHQRISEIKIENADQIINYNYTKIAENLFKNFRRKPDKTDNNDSFIRYINGSIEVNESLKVKEIETNIVVGYTNRINKEVPKDLFPFEKRSRRIIKNTDYVNLNKIIDGKEFDLVIMGHSCGEADSDILAKLLSNTYLRTAVILCYSVDVMISIYNNIKSMLEPEIFDELMEHSDYRRNLYFSVNPNSGATKI